MSQDSARQVRERGSPGTPATPHGHGSDAPDDPSAELAPTRDFSASAGLSTSSIRLSEGPLSFGRYLLREKIGQGGMGAVFLAEQPELKREVAIKIIRGGELATEEQVLRFHSEAQAVARLNHPNIVAIHDFGFTDGLHYFTMDLMRGGSLAQRLASQEYTAEESAGIVMQLARAVEYLHKRGVIHRDLKPGNVMFDEGGRPCLTDFGLAKILEDQTGCTRTGDVVGTASYMSPEQASGLMRDVTPLTDVYSLGAILYEMLTGHPPFVGDNFVDTLLRVMESEPTPPRWLRRDLSRELEQVCLKCLEKRPERRYATAAALAEDLERYLHGDPVESCATGWLQTTRRVWRLYPALSAHCAILAAVALIVAIRHVFANGANENFWVVEGIIAAWGALSLGLQWLQAREHRRHLIQSAWAVLDPLLITALIYLAEAPRETLLAAYPAYIAASGLWVRERLVATATLASLVGYAVLLGLRPNLGDPLHHALILASLMIIVGVVVGFQVRRLRILNRFL
ncbi:MAG: serine/threonine protein kinase [Planctomycetales bacterium]|nr:serine/threonine protein kinase [Planctomycetales bacterium]